MKHLSILLMFIMVSLAEAHLVKGADKKKYLHDNDDGNHAHSLIYLPGRDAPLYTTWYLANVATLKDLDMLVDDHEQALETAENDYGEPLIRVADRVNNSVSGLFIQVEVKPPVDQSTGGTTVVTPTSNNAQSNNSNVQPNTNTNTVTNEVVTPTTETQSKDEPERPDEFKHCNTLDMMVLHDGRQYIKYYKCDNGGWETATSSVPKAPKATRMKPKTLATSWGAMKRRR